MASSDSKPNDLVEVSFIMSKTREVRVVEVSLSGTVADATERVAESFGIDNSEQLVMVCGGSRLDKDGRLDQRDDIATMTAIHVLIVNNSA